MGRSHGKRWLAAIRRAAKARRGKSATFSLSRSATFKRLWKDPKFRAKQIANRKKEWKNKEVRARRIAGTQSLEAKAKHRVSMQRWWATPENHKKMLVVRREAGRRSSTRKLVSKGMKKKWADPKFHEKMRTVRSKQLQDPYNRQVMSAAIEAVWEREGYREKTMTSRRRKGMYSAAWRRKVSLGVQKAVKAGKRVWNRGLTKDTDARLMGMSKRQRGQIPNWKKYFCWYVGQQGKILMRSRWEAAFALWMDAHEIEWVYEPQYFYVGNGVWTGVSYVPDFYLPGQNDYVEVKGWLDPGQAAKYKRFRKLYPDVRVEVFEGKHLMAAGILTKGGQPARAYRNGIKEYKRKTAKILQFPVRAVAA